MAKDELGIDDFKEWVRDPRGEWYWSAMKELLEERKGDQRSLIRTEKTYQAAIVEGLIQGVEAALTAPTEIIEEKTGQDTGEDNVSHS